MTSVINVKINEDNEIEYMDLAEEDDEQEEDDEHEEHDEDDNQERTNDIDDENMLVPTGNGVMTIRMKEKTIVEHVCGKCSKSYKSFGVKKILFILIVIFLKKNFFRV